MPKSSSQNPQQKIFHMERTAGIYEMRRYSTTR